MKKKCKIVSSLLMLSGVFAFAGCGREQLAPVEELSKEDNQRQEGVVTPGSDEKEKRDKENSNETVSSEQIWIDAEKINQIVEELNAEEKFLAVMPLNEETLLLQCKNRKNERCVFYVLHMNEGEENLQRADYNLDGDVDCYIYEDCIVLYDTANHVIVLDSELEILNEILIPDSVSQSRFYMGNRNYCIFPREQKVFYYESVLENGELYVGLYETDYTCEESRLVYKMEGAETNLNFLNGFSKICPGYSQKGIFFTGDYFETIDSQSKSCVGYLDLASDTPVVCKTNMRQMELTANGAVFFDGYRESDKGYSGELLMIDESGEVSRMKTAHFKESERVSCDRQGRMLTC